MTRHTTSFPNARGLDRRNLHYMRSFAEAWPEGHVRVLLDRLDDHAVWEWYAAGDAADGWSRAVLETMLANRLHLRQGAAPSNFPATLPGADSDRVQEITRDPYVFDFVRLQPGYRELDVQPSCVGDAITITELLEATTTCPPQPPPPQRRPETTGDSVAQRRPTLLTLPRRC